MLENPQISNFIKWYPSSGRRFVACG